ncbi:unannotated protein [freshwater metagenome]|uniref:Unannotated protein n=1 Tax=freshwater metagenome TaxID=449393 RepID=A0A6J6DF18_9ZZZZ|nr:hypothetical protein [Actinomycetota bacterium]
MTSRCLAARVRSFQESDNGSSLVLVIFAGLLCIAVALAVVSATSLYLERKRLLSLADGAALVGAESYDLEQVQIDGGRVVPRLTPTGVRNAVVAFVVESTPEDLDDVRIVEASTRDGRSATVSLASVWHPPIATFLMPAGMNIDVTSSARSVLWR